jgi:hypothetical protein
MCARLIFTTKAATQELQTKVNVWGDGSRESRYSFGELRSSSSSSEHPLYDGRLGSYRASTWKNEGCRASIPIYTRPKKVEYAKLYETIRGTHREALYSIQYAQVRVKLLYRRGRGSVDFKGFG